MTISAISSTSVSGQQPVNNFMAVRQSFTQLQSAIQSGDLQSAQSAYATLSTQVGSNPNSPFAQALNQIGQDLQSGNIGQAQKDMASIQQQMQQAQQARAHHHHHHHGGGGTQAANANTAPATTSTTDPSPSSTTLNLTA